MIRRWLIDPSASPSWYGWEVFSWLLVAGLVWLIWPIFWPLWLGAEILYLAFLGET